MFRRLMNSFQRFMYGRNGTDQLNLVLLGTGFVLMLLSSVLYQIALYNSLIALLWFALLLQALAYGLLIFCIFRSLSRNLAARQRENRRWLQFWKKLSDRKNHYYRCPNCRQTVRVPRGHGKICIKCPKCGEKFIRKS